MVADGRYRHTDAQIRGPKIAKIGDKNYSTLKMLVEVPDLAFLGYRRVKLLNDASVASKKNDNRKSGKKNDKTYRRKLVAVLDRALLGNLGIVIFISAGKNCTLANLRHKFEN